MKERTKYFTESSCTWYLLHIFKQDLAQKMFVSLIFCMSVSLYLEGAPYKEIWMDILTDTVKLSLISLDVTSCTFPSS